MKNDVIRGKAVCRHLLLSWRERGRSPASRRVSAVIAAAVLMGSTTVAFSAPALIKAVGVENEYADVISQIGGRYVQVTAIETDPNTDPHTFEVNPRVAGQIAAADLVVKNGIGYDAWADKIIEAAPNSRRKVIDVQHLLGLPDSTPNPHLWYAPKTMPAVAKQVASDLSFLNPAQAAYFQANEKKFEASLEPWSAAIAAFKARHPGTPVAVTESVADYMLEAAGIGIETPYSMQAAIMSGTDPSPQDVTKQNALFADHKVKVFVYNQQVTDALTQSFLALAKKNGIPVVGVYETMPTPGFTYQSWMLAEVNALDRAVTGKVSTEVLRAGK
ncbi:zinc ABC transporter substrate-binding protein [Paraburkholderia sp. B3]|uniref:metal ABC transporter solute-binding protein, Zn/Mn family n=1 Tax=Paraburkholderia sp. B3 TaxID=3134791 RepID=UPI0039826F15